MDRQPITDGGVDWEGGGGMWFPTCPDPHQIGGTKDDECMGGTGLWPNPGGPKGGDVGGG